jgi:hypothetical protein
MVEYVEGEGEDGLKVVRPGFVVDTQSKAEWAMATLARSERNIGMRKNTVREIQMKIEARLAEANKRDEDTVRKMTELLRPWAELEIAKQHGAKHLKLVAGDVGYRQNPDRLDVVNEKDAIAALPPECIRTKVEVDKVAVKKLIKTTGEVPDGCMLVDGDVQWYVKTNVNDLDDDALNLLLPDIPE